MLGGTMKQQQKEPKPHTEKLHLHCPNTQAREEFLALLSRENQMIQKTKS